MTKKLKFPFRLKFTTTIHTAYFLKLSRCIYFSYIRNYCYKLSSCSWAFYLGTQCSPSQRLQRSEPTSSSAVHSKGKPQRPNTKITTVTLGLTASTGALGMWSSCSQCSQQKEVFHREQIVTYPVWLYEFSKAWTGTQERRSLFLPQVQEKMFICLGFVSLFQLNLRISQFTLRFQSLGFQSQKLKVVESNYCH